MTRIFLPIPVFSIEFTAFSRLQGVFGTIPDTFEAKNAFGAVLPLPGVIGHVDIHRTNPLAFSAGDTFFFVAGDTEQGIIAHRLQKDGDRADVFAEGAVIFERKGQGDSDRVIQDIPDDEGPEHDAFHISDVRQEQGGDKDQGQGKGDIPDPADLFPGLFRRFIREKVEHHRRPAGVSAPASSEEQRPEDLRYGIVYGRGFKDSGEKIIPEAFDLHVFMTDQAEVNEHIQAD